MSSKRPSLRAFERQVAEGKLQESLQTALQILQCIDERFGRLELLDISDVAQASDGSDEQIALIFCTRFAAALGRLLIDPGLSFTPVDYERLLLQHRWVDVIFSLSGFRSSDHLLPIIAKTEASNQLKIGGSNFLRLLAMMTLNSLIGIDFEEFWRANRVAAALAFLQYLSSRYVFGPRAFELRERLLEWLPGRLEDVKLGSMTLSRLPEIYMHCSYAITPKKHAIKRALIAQMRRACLEAGVREIAPGGTRGDAARPVAFVICEHFIVGHSMYRTHSLAVRSLRERFHVVGVVYKHQINPEISDLFDETMAMPGGDFMEGIRTLAAEIASRGTELIFYPSVGMTPHAIALASLRLARVQCASYGHAASTMSPAIDYFVAPEDFIGSPERLSEKVLALPADYMPFRPRQLKRPPAKAPPGRKTDGKVRIGIPASTMKLNPKFFDTLVRVELEAKTPVEFQFFPLASTGLPHLELTRVVRSRLPKATVFPESPHDDYLARLGACDFFLCPFPYGNTNSIVDSIVVGLPGICLDGPEPHEHIDTGLFRRIGFQAELSTKSRDEYIRAAVRMIDDEAWRIRCREIAFDCDMAATFFTGDASQFCRAVANIVWPDKTEAPELAPAGAVTAVQSKGAASPKRSARRRQDR